MERATKFKWLIENESTLIDQKKAEKKQADPFSFHIIEKSEFASKAETEQSDGSKIRVKVVINTTGLMDSHGDVHIPNLWKKSLSEQKKFYLVNQHDFSFDGILSDDVKAYAETISWKDLGYKFEGETQALIFDAVIDSNSAWISNSVSNKKLFELYKANKVPNHSVGMRYIKYVLCMDTEEEGEEKYKANYDKYISYVANKEQAELEGYFWAVTEAKVIEGSAVVRGSNYATPTLEVEQKGVADIVTTDEIKDEPHDSTQIETKEHFINPNMY